MELIYDGSEIIGIKLSNGTTITHEHYQDCCENVYADWESLKDVDLSPLLNTKLIKVEVVKDFGFRLNGIPVPAYNEQNGYYSNNLQIVVDYGNYRLSTEVGNYDGLEHRIN